MARKARSRGRRGLGSITERNGQYLARWSRTEGGKRTRAARTFALKNDAEWWLSEARRHGEAPEDPLLADYLRSWLAGKRKASERTRAQYRNHIEDHIIPVLGGYRLGELRERHVQAFVDGRLRHKSERFKKQPHAISPATVGKILATLKMALAAAVPKLIPDNPAAKVERPSVDKRDVKAMTPEYAADMVAAVKDTHYEQLVRVLLGSGMRIGETVALNQGDVQEGFVRLRTPTTKKRKARAVRLSADANEAIWAAIAAAPRRGDGDPVFFGRKGGRLRADVASHAIADLLEAAGLERITPHKIRHGTATLLVRAGVPMRAVAEQLGHADPGTTSRFYAHVAPETLQEAMGVLDKAVER